jgi:hypothetical protein
MRPAEPTPARLEDLPDVFPLWPTAGSLLGLGRNLTFEAAKRREIPTLRFGKRLLVSKAALRRLLAAEEPTTVGAGEPVSLRRVAR